VFSYFENRTDSRCAPDGKGNAFVTGRGARQS